MIQSGYTKGKRFMHCHGTKSCHFQWMEKIKVLEDNYPAYECPVCGFYNSIKRRTDYGNRTSCFKITDSHHVMPKAVCECGMTGDFYDL